MVNVGKSSKSTMHWSFGWRQRHDSTMIMSSRPSTVISFSTICESRWCNSHTHTHLKCHTHTHTSNKSGSVELTHLIYLNLELPQRIFTDLIVVQVFGIGQCALALARLWIHVSLTKLQMDAGGGFKVFIFPSKWWWNSITVGSYTNQKLIFTKTNCGRPTWNRGGTSSILFFRRDRLVVLRIHIDLVKPSLGLRKTVKQPANEAIRIRKSHLDQFGIWPHLCWVKASP